MAAINTGKVVVGGLAAGLVMNVIDFVANMYVLQNTMKADFDKLNPSLWAAMNSTSAMIGFVAIDFILGILLVWLYAAIRPRFGAGAGTAVKAGLYFWVFGGVIWYSFVLLGMFSTTSFVMAACVSLVNLLASAWVGGMLYKEAA